MTPAQVRSIRKQLRDGYRVEGIAAKWGVTPEAIREAAKRSNKPKPQKPPLVREAERMAKLGFPMHVIIANFGDIL